MEDPVICICLSYRQSLNLKVRVLQGEIRIGTYLMTVNDTSECGINGEVTAINLSGDSGKGRHSVEVATVDDIVWITGLRAGEPYGMFRGSYLISKDAEPKVHRYVIQLDERKKNIKYEKEKFYIQTTMPNVPPKIRNRGQGIKTFLEEKDLQPGDETVVEITSWWPWPEFLVGNKDIVGKAHLVEGYVKSAT